MDSISPDGSEPTAPLQLFAIVYARGQTEDETGRQTEELVERARQDGFARTNIVTFFDLGNEVTGIGAAMALSATGTAEKLYLPSLNHLSSCLDGVVFAVEEFVRDGTLPVPTSEQVITSAAEVMGLRWRMHDKAPLEPPRTLAAQEPSLN